MVLEYIIFFIFLILIMSLGYCYVYNILSLGTQSSLRIMDIVKCCDIDADFKIKLENILQRTNLRAEACSVTNKVFKYVEAIYYGMSVVILASIAFYLLSNCELDKAINWLGVTFVIYCVYLYLVLKKCSKTIYDNEDSIKENVINKQ